MPSKQDREIKDARARALDDFFGAAPAAAAPRAAEPAKEPEQTPEAGTRREIPKGYKPDPQYIETRSRRVQMLMQPTLYAAIKARAEAQGRTVNDFIHATLEAAIKAE